MRVDGVRPDLPLPDRQPSASPVLLAARGRVFPTRGYKGRASGLGGDRGLARKARARQLPPLLPVAVGARSVPGRSRSLGRGWRDGRYSRPRRYPQPRRHLPAPRPGPPLPATSPAAPGRGRRSTPGGGEAAAGPPSPGLSSAMGRVARPPPRSPPARVPGDARGDWGQSRPSAGARGAAACMRVCGARGRGEAAGRCRTAARGLVSFSASSLSTKSRFRSVLFAGARKE